MKNHVCRRHLFNELMCKKDFTLIFTRFFTYSQLTLCENSEIKNSNKSKGKITVIKKILTGKENDSSVLEWRKASSIIKRLNWENKCLFGPVQSSKSLAYDQKKIDASNQIIQHKTRIPVIEPLEENIASNSKNFDYHNSFDINLISSFPLVNRSAFPNDKLSDLNYLRKQLEFLCNKFSVPSVSTILEKTMPKEQLEILNKWKQNMINELGEEGFEKYQKELFANGASLHSIISSYLSSTPETDLQIQKANIGHWRSLKNIFPNINDVKLLEEFVTHPFLCYKGVVDCFAKYKNHLVVIDWKTSKKSKLTLKSTYDNPLQIAAYVGALNFDPKFQYLASEGLIVVAYESGLPATVHFINENTMMRYWQEWLRRIKRFWELKMLEDQN